MIFPPCKPSSSSSTQPIGDADPKAAKLEGQLHRVRPLALTVPTLLSLLPLQHLVDRHGYQSSDPEDYMELDLFSAAHQDALASEEVRRALCHRRMWTAGFVTRMAGAALGRTLYRRSE